MTVNWARVHELRDEIGHEDFAEIAELFVSEVQQAVARVLNGDNDCDTLEAELHSIKGSSLNIGFASLADLAAEGERAAAGGTVPEAVLARLGEALVQSMEEFTDGIAKLDDAA